MGSRQIEPAVSPNSWPPVRTCSFVPPEACRLIIDSDGDLILKVGEMKCLPVDISQGSDDSLHFDQATNHGHELPVIYVVCSKALSRASSTWKRLLYGGFSEQKPHCASIASEWVAELPDDNPKPMLTVLNIIHSRYECVPRVTDLIDLKDLYQLSVLTDKYNLTRILRPWASSWMKSVRETYEAGRRGGTNPAVSDLEHLSWIAWEIGDSDLFQKASTDLALHCSIDANSDFQNDSGGKVVSLFNSTLEPPELHVQLKAARLNGIESLVTLYGGVIAKLLEKRSPSFRRSESFCHKCEPVILGTIVRSLAWESSFLDVMSDHQCVSSTALKALAGWVVVDADNEIVHHWRDVIVSGDSNEALNLDAKQVSTSVIARTSI